MATRQPYRNYYQLEAESWVWWADDPAYGSWIEHNGDKLIMASESYSPVMKCAVKFKLPSSLPGWITKGPISSKLMGVGAFVISAASDMWGQIGLRALKITSAWDSSSSVAQMRAVAAPGAFTLMGFFQDGYSGVDITHDLTSGTGVIVPDANGIMFYCNSNVYKAVTLASDPKIVLRYYYQYAPGFTGHADAIQRTDYSGIVESMLKGETGYKRVQIAVNGLKKERQPAESNASISVLKGQGSIIQRQLNYPKPWEPALMTAGALPVSMSERAEMQKAEGSLLETTVSIIDLSGASHTLAKQKQIANESSENDGGVGELALSSPMQAMMARGVTLWDVLGQESDHSSFGVEYSDEPILYVLLSVIMNASLLPFSSYYYDDFSELYTRFRTTWQNVTLTKSEVLGMTVKNFWDTYAPMYGLHMTEMADGCWSMFHPGVYRSSMRVKRISNKDTAKASFKIGRKSRTSTFTTVKISDNRSPGATNTEVVQPRKIQVDADWRESAFSFTAQGVIFYSGIPSGFGADWEVAKKGLGNQQAQYLCGECLEIAGVLTLEYIGVNTGDILVIETDSREDLLAICTFASLDPNTLRTKFKALHFPDYNGLHSVFQSDGILGLWRGLFNSERGTDGDWTFGAWVPVYLRAHWQGQMNGGFLATGASSYLTNTANYSDTFDLAMGGMWELVYDDMQEQPSWWNATTVVPFMVWRKAAGDETLVFGIERPGYSGGDAVKLNSICVRYYGTMNAMGTAGIVSFNAPPGLLGLQTLISYETCFQTASFALSWKDTTIRLYLDRRLILETTNAFFNKSAWTDVWLHSSKGGPLPGAGASASQGMTQTMISSLTHIGQDGWIENLQRLNGPNGIDPFYGPDDIADVIDT